jgi:hypothetical protein
VPAVLAVPGPDLDAGPVVDPSAVCPFTGTSGVSTSAAAGQGTGRGRGGRWPSG